MNCGPTPLYSSIEARPPVLYCAGTVEATVDGNQSGSRMAISNYIGVLPELAEEPVDLLQCILQVGRYKVDGPRTEHTTATGFQLPINQPPAT